MKVMIASQGYPSEKYPMNGIHQFVYAKALQKQGIDVFVACLDMRSIRRFRKFGYEEKIVDGIRTYAWNLPVGGLGVKAEGKYSVWAMKKLYKKIIAKEKNIDLIHSHFTETSYAIAKFNKDYNYPYIISEHSSSINKENILDIPYAKREMAKYAYENCDKLIVGSPFFRDRIHKNFHIEPIVMPTISETDLFKVGKKDINRQAYKIVSTGNLKKSKGHREVIEAFGKSLKNKDAKLYIFGGGEDYNYLKALIEKLDLEKQVFLRGYISIEDIAKEYKDADLFVLASHSETYGKAYIEAMKAGLPVISTANGGSEHFINEDNGLVVPVENVDKLKDGLIYMFNHRDKYDKLSISEFIENNFSELAATKKLIELYKDLLKR
ncbi:MAG: glycosyltransferase family 4 protein [Tissierellia bacterium]|nr:glycosyltransferase family 4 protein [Tissierellia bacterium]